MTSFDLFRWRTNTPSSGSCIESISTSLLHTDFKYHQWHGSWKSPSEERHAPVLQHQLFDLSRQLRRPSDVRLLLRWKVVVRKCFASAESREEDSKHVCPRIRRTSNSKTLWSQCKGLDWKIGIDQFILCTVSCGHSTWILQSTLWCRLPQK